MLTIIVSAKVDLPPVRTDLSEAAHFLYLINGEEPGEAAKDIDVAYILHADHGMNAHFPSRVTIGDAVRPIFSDDISHWH